MRDTAEGPRIDAGEVMVQRVAAIVIEELDRRNAERMAAMMAQIAQEIRFARPIHFDRETLIHTLDNHRVILDSRERGVFCHVHEMGEWEGHVRRVYRKVLKPGMTVIDVGANIGLHALLAAQVVGRHGAVHAVEADPITVDLLIRNLELNGLHLQTHIHAAACVAKSGQTIDFHRLAEEPMMSSLVVPAWKGLKQKPTKIRVPTIALADLSGGPVDLLKIDAEGSEALVLRGAGDVVGRDTVCVVEILRQLIDDVSGPGGFAEVMEFFASRGFVMFRLPNYGEPLRIDTDWSEHIWHNSGDFAFVHPEGRHAGAFGV